MSNVFYIFTGKPIIDSQYVRIDDTTVTSASFVRNRSKQYASLPAYVTRDEKLNIAITNLQNFGWNVKVQPNRGLEFTHEKVTGIHTFTEACEWQQRMFKAAQQ